MYIELYSTDKVAGLGLCFDLNGKDLGGVDVDNLFGRTNYAVDSDTFLGGEKLRPLKALKLDPGRLCQGG